MADPEIKLIDIENLELDLTNPRSPDQKNQRAAIETLVKQSGAKLIRLAEDIAKSSGLDPSQLPLVRPSNREEIYVVMEGNRRLAALKLIHNLALLNSLDIPKRTKDRFRHLHDAHSASLPKQILCSIISEEEARRWIYLRHTGVNDGVGVVSWDSVATQRFRGDSPALQAIDTIAATDLLDDETLAKLYAKIPISTLKRIFENAEARKPLGVDVSSTGFSYIEDRETVNRRLALIISDLVNKRIQTRDVYTKDQIPRYVNEVREQEASSSDSTENERDDSLLIPNTRAFDFGIEGIAIPADERADAPSDSDKSLAPLEPLGDGDSEPSDRPNVTLKENQHEITVPSDIGNAPQQLTPPTVTLPTTPSSTPPSVPTSTPPALPPSIPPTAPHITPPTAPTSTLPVGPRPRVISPTRRYLLPTNFRLAIQEQRLNKIYHELRSLPVEEYANCVAVMFRVFVELSVDTYATRNGISLMRPVPPLSSRPARDMSFSEKVRTVGQHLFDSGRLTLQQHNLLITWSNTQNVSLSIDFLHEYVHNTDASPAPSDVKAHWDHIQTFVQRLHE